MTTAAAGLGRMPGVLALLLALAAAAGTVAPLAVAEPAGSGPEKPAAWQIGPRQLPPPAGASGCGF